MTLQKHGNKTLDELTFTDLYIEMPEQEFTHIHSASRAAIIWLSVACHRVATIHIPRINMHHFLGLHPRLHERL